MKDEARLYSEILRKTDCDPEERKKAEKAVADSDIKAHGKAVPFSMVPLFINQRDEAFFTSILEKIQSILDKMTRKYVADETYRKIFGFSSEMERLICLPCHYDTIIPVGRYDLFLNPQIDGDEDFRFCEFNTDGTGGMSRDGFIVNELLQGKAMRAFQKNYDVSAYPIIETITDRLIEIYHSDQNAVEHPNIVITDFREEGVMSDFDRFVACFEKRGVPSRFVDVRDLFFDGEKLFDRNDGMVIHGIYRRLVTSVLLERQDECQALIDAVEAEKVVLLGHFRTALAHSKAVNMAMTHPLTREILTEEENAFVQAHIPVTYPLSREMPQTLLDDAVENQAAWIIKPEEGFGARGVFAGMDHDARTWQEILRQNMDDHVLLQRFISPGKMPLLGPEEEELSEWPVMIGLYQAGGKPAGFYCRAGKEGVIDFEHGGIMLPVVRVEKNTVAD